jgi:hypothetical protein
MKYFFLKFFYEVISIINKKRHYFKGFTRGGPLGALTHEPKFKQDVKTRSKHSDEDVINNMSSFVK